MPDLEVQSSSSSSPAARPTQLSLVIDDANQRPPVTYSGQPSNGSSPTADSPFYQSALDSSAPLILVHDDDDDDDDRDVERPLNMNFSSSDEDDDLDDSLSPLYQINGKMSIPPLPPFTIFMYLLSPYLKLGALLLPYYQLPLKYGLSGLLISAVLAVVARHLLYLLARYLRKADLEEVVSHTFVSTKKRGRRGERRREFLKFLVRLGTATLRILLAAVYLDECVHFVLPLITPLASLHQSSTEFGLAIGAIILALLLSYPGSLASRLVIYTTCLSIFTYLLWLGAITYLYTQAALPINSERLNSRCIWDGLVITAFVFTSSNTLPLYASTKGTIQPLLFDTDTSLALPVSDTAPSTDRQSRRDGNLKQPLYRSFKFLSLLSITLAVGLTLPLVGFAAFPNESPRAPATVAESNGYPEQFSVWKSPHPSGDSTPATRIQAYITPSLASLTLLLGVPQLLITIPSIPAGSLKWLRNGPRNVSVPEFLSQPLAALRKSMVSLSMLFLVLTTLSFNLFETVRCLATSLAIFATYCVPAILHVLAHTFKSPLSIILPSTYFSSSFLTTIPQASSINPPTLCPSNGVGLGGDLNSPLGDNSNYSPTSTGASPQSTAISRHRHTQSQLEQDDLLQRKERALQKRQMRKRIVWDIWAWGIFFGAFVVLGFRARMS